MGGDRGNSSQGKKNRVNTKGERRERVCARCAWSLRIQGSDGGGGWRSRWAKSRRVFPAGDNAGFEDMEAKDPDLLEQLFSKQDVY